MRIACSTIIALLACGCNCGDQSLAKDGGNVGGGGGGNVGGGGGSGGAAGGGGGSGGAAGGGGGSGGAAGGGGGSGGAAGGGGGSDAGYDYNCRGFMNPAGWTVTAGYRAVEVATRDAGLNQPVAVTFAGGPYNDSVFVVNQGSAQLVRLSPALTEPTPFATSFTPAPQLFTALLWDRNSIFDGQLYLADQGSDGDADSKLYRISPSGTASLFASGQNLPGFDDIYAMVFTPQMSAWPRGMLVAGDTDTLPSRPSWGLVTSDGGVSTFSYLAGVEGADVDETNGTVLASRPAGGGYAGDDTITIVAADGGTAGSVVSGIPGIHAVVKAPAGPFGGKVYAASWASQRVFAVEADGGTTTIASGLSLTNYGANALAFSPNGKILLVADRAANRLVCIEPTN